MEELKLLLLQPVGEDSTCDNVWVPTTDTVLLDQAGDKDLKNKDWADMHKPPFPLKYLSKALAAASISSWQLSSYFAAADRAGPSHHMLSGIL